LILKSGLMNILTTATKSTNWKRNWYASLPCCTERVEFILSSIMATRLWRRPDLLPYPGCLNLLFPFGPGHHTPFSS